MSVRCSECGAATTWDDTVGSAVCTTCGSLTDPSQSVLTSSLWGDQNNNTDDSLWDPAASTTLKSLRTGNNWDLAGQGKESRDRKNAYAMAEFIKSLAVSFNAAGLSPRAIILFNQAKNAIHFRWGTKSRSVAGACLSIALRESNRPDSLRDIASVLKVPPSAIAREFMSITSVLNLSLTLVDSSVHISTLQAHLTSTLREHQHESHLPPSLVKALQPLCLRAVAHTAISLSELLSRLSPDHDVLRLPAPPTACGIFMLALEAESRGLLNPLGDLARCLGARCHVAKGVVMARYKTIQDEAASWIEKVPWLDKYESRNGRAKVAKRLVVARGLKDAIKFQEEIWQQLAKPDLHLEVSDDEANSDEDKVSVDISRPGKRLKLNHAMSRATQFLLDPLGNSAPSATLHASGLSFDSPTPNFNLPLASYILTSPFPALGRHPPTRLQLLALDRGGVSEAQIPDSDLFADGEYEKLLRSEHEVQMLRVQFGWPEGEDADTVDETETSKKASKPRKKRTAAGELPEEGTAEEGLDVLDGSALKLRKKSRLDMEALARFLADTPTPDGEGEDGIDVSLIGLGCVVDPSDDEDGGYSFGASFLNGVEQDEARPDLDSTLSPRYSTNTTGPNMDEEVVLENWRPPTPERGGADSHYEEEYD
ncbi:hypothetical protein B0H34DRAFT_672062 [Crassisporium funariophilum]|nr:hypothetical protein B0H34DRAFT_672062 [Crassisporium funariophilum]